MLHHPVYDNHMQCFSLVKFKCAFFKYYQTVCQFIIKQLDYIIYRTLVTGARPDIVVDMVPDNELSDLVICHDYKSYVVTMLHKLRASTQVQLGKPGDN